MALAAQRTGVSPTDYFYLRTREELLLDAAAWQASFTTPVLMLAASLGLIDRTSEPPVPEEHPGQAPGQPPPPPAQRPQRRDRTRPPAWYRRVDGRGYSVHDMDTQDARRFAARAEHLRSQWSAISRWHLGEWNSGRTLGLATDATGTKRLTDIVALRKARLAAAESA